MKYNGDNVAHRVRSVSDWLLQHARITAIATFVALAILGYLASGLELDASPEAYFSHGQEWAQYRDIERDYDIGEPVIIALRESGGTVFDVETLAAVTELGRRLVDLDEVDDVVSLVTTTALSRSGDTLEIAPLLPQGKLTPDNALKLGQRIAEHPFFRRLLVDENRETTFILVQLPRDADMRRRLQTMTLIRAEADRFAASHRTIHLAGGAVTKEALTRSTLSDVVVFLPSVLVLLSALLWVAFGEWPASVATLMSVGAPAIIVLGGLGALNLTMNLAGTGVLVLMVASGLSQSVHYLHEVRRQHARFGRSSSMGSSDADVRRAQRYKALLSAVEAVAWPAAVGTIVASVGFAALAVSTVGPWRVFAVISAATLPWVYFSNHCLLPALLGAFGYPARPAPEEHRGLADWGAGWAIRRARQLPLLLGFIGLGFGASYAAMRQIEANVDFVSFLSADHRARKDLKVVEKTFGGAHVIEAVVTAPRPGWFRGPEGLGKLDELSRDLGQLDGVDRLVSLTEYLRVAMAYMDGTDGRSRGRLPSSEKETAQLELLDPTSFALLANDEMSQARLTLQVRLEPGEKMVELLDLAEQTAAITLKDTGATVTLSGVDALSARFGRSLQWKAARSLFVVLLAVLLVGWLLTRNFGLAFNSALITALSVTLTWAAMAGLGLGFDTHAIFVPSLAVTVILADAHRIGARYTRSKLQGSPHPEARAHYALRHVAAPLWWSTGLMLVGFGILFISSFQPTSRVGLSSSILVVISSSLLMAAFVPLVVAVDRGGDPPRPAARRASSLSALLQETKDR